MPSQYNVYYDSISSNNRIFGYNDIIYWDSTNRTFSNGTIFWTYDTIGNKWGTANNERSDIISSDLYLALDGTIRNSNYEEINLTKGNYFTHIYKIYKVLSPTENIEVADNYELFYFTIPAYQSGIPEYTLIFNDRQIYYYNNEWFIEYTKKDVENLSENIILLANTPLNLHSGFYRFSDSQKGLYYHEALANNLIWDYNDGVFYFDYDSQSINLDLKSWFYDPDDTNDWLIAEHSNITNEIVNLRNKIPTSQAVYNALQNIQPSGSSVTPLTSNLVLLANTQLTLESGFYYTGSYKIYLHSVDNANVLIGNNELVYVANNWLIITDNYNIFLSGLTSDWEFDNHSGITDTISNDNTLIPTSKAVYDALQNIPSESSFYTELNAVLVLNSDGTITCDGDTLTYGYYLTSGYGIEFDNVVYADYANTIIYYNSSLGYVFKCLDNDTKGLKKYFFYRSGTNTWESYSYNFNTSIPASRR